jgi:hypothetical protein
MSQAIASTLVVLTLFGLAIFCGIAPPQGFEELPYRIIFPFVLIAVGFVQLENVRMRAHMRELIGALKTAVGRTQANRGVAPTTQEKGKAIQILLDSLGAADETVRQTAARQLTSLTGEDFGTDSAAWKRWWLANRAQFESSE